MQLEKINQKTLVKKGDSKDIKIRSSNTNKPRHSKITKGNSTNKLYKDKSTTRCKRSKTILESNIGTERT